MLHICELKGSALPTVSLPNLAQPVGPVSGDKMLDNPVMAKCG